MKCMHIVVKCSITFVRTWCLCRGTFDFIMIVMFETQCIVMFFRQLEGKLTDSAIVRLSRKVSGQNITGLARLERKKWH